MALLPEDEIIRRRLINEGDSGQEDRRIGQLLKSLVDLSNLVSIAPTSDGEKDKINFLANRIQLLLATHETGMRKAASVTKMNSSEADRYKHLEVDLDKQINDAQQNIASLRGELVKARELRRKRQEYDLLANIIEQLPPRLSMEADLLAKQAELKSLMDTDASLSDKIETRKRQFYVLSLTLHELKTMLDAEETGEHMDESSSSPNNAMA